MRQGITVEYIYIPINEETDKMFNINNFNSYFGIQTICHFSDLSQFYILLDNGNNESTFRSFKSYKCIVLKYSIDINANGWHIYNCY